MTGPIGGRVEQRARHPVGVVTDVGPCQPGMIGQQPRELIQFAALHGIDCRHRERIITRQDHRVTTSVGAGDIAAHPSLASSPDDTRASAGMGHGRATRGPSGPRAVDASLSARQTGRMSSPIRSRAFTTTLEALPKGKARVPVPFDPNELWGTKREHHVGGMIAGVSVRGTIVCDASGWSLSLGPAWLRDYPVWAPGTVSK